MTSSSVLDIFKEITTIPRESGHEGPFTDWLQRWAAEHSLACKRDATGNILITREAAPGRESVPAVVLQAHQDMVCDKLAGVEHDFRKDPIDYVIEDGWMVAKNTTLGADDGIGVAAALALLADDKPSGKVECLFTISEETGMDGAHALQSGFFTGKTLINLDSEDEGQLFVGCAGGLNTIITFSHGREEINGGWARIKLSISGGLGGHSGDDIDKGRANTVQLMARFLYSELQQGMQLIKFKGGSKSNAIARECVAAIAVPDREATAARFAAFGADVRQEFHNTDPELAFGSEFKDCKHQPMDSDSAARIIRSMFACPHGRQAMSQDIEGLVQTSTNLASISMDEEGKVKIVTSQRSAAQSERRAIAARVRAVFELAGAEVKHINEYPGWNPDMNSNVLKRSVEAYRRLFSQEPLVLAIHAGLECGLFLEKFPDLDMISFGPTLRKVHTPGECLDLASMDKFVALLEDLVCNFE